MSCSRFHFAGAFGNVNAPSGPVGPELRVVWTLVPSTSKTASTDAPGTGWIDCDGGTNPDVSLTVDSNGAGPASPSILTIPGDPDPSAPAGSAVVPVLLRFGTANVNDADCSTLDYGSAPFIPSAFTSRTATSTVENDWIDGAPGAVGPNTVTLSGQPFVCTAWSGGGAGTASRSA